MKLTVSWTNNEPTAAQRVYATDPATKQRKRIAEVAAGLNTVVVDLDTLPNGPIVWPSFFTVVSVKGDVESAEASAKVMSTFEDQMAAKFGAVMDFAGKFRPEVLPDFTVKASSVPDVKFNSTYPHFVVDGSVFQIMGDAANLYNPATLASVPNDGFYNIPLAGSGVEGVPFRGAPGEFYILGDGPASEIAYRWDGTDLWPVADMTEGKTNASYRHSVMGHNGKIYRFGGIGSVDAGKLLISVFDPKARSWEVIRQNHVAYQGNGADIFGAIDHNGILVIVDITYKRAVVINTNTGALSTTGFDEFAPLNGLTARTIVGGNGVIYALTSAKQLTGIFLKGGQIEKIELITTYDNAAYATCLAQAVTGELVVGTQDEGKLVLIDPVAKTFRVNQIPGGKWINAIYRHGNDLTVIDVEKAHHIAFEKYPVTFDVTYEQVRQGATNYIRQI